MHLSMKINIILFAAFILLTTTISSQQIEWLTLAEAMEAQKKIPKKIFMDVYTDWCGPCKLLDKNTFQNPDVSSYISEHYYAVKFNAEGQEEINFYDRKLVYIGSTNYSNQTSYSLGLRIFSSSIVVYYRS